MFNTAYLLLTEMRELLQVARPTGELLEAVTTKQEEQRRLLHTRVVATTNHIGVLQLMPLQHTLQRVAGITQLVHLAVERRDLIIQRSDQFLLVLDILPEQLQFVQRCFLIILRLLEHLIGLLNLPLQFLLFFLQIFDAICSES